MKNTYIFGVAVIVVLGGFLLVTSLMGRKVSPPPAVACTEEALMCPDGSGVGRSGSECRFAPCTDHESFTGVIDNSNGTYRLLMPTPEGGAGATYVLSLDASAVPVGSELIGTRVVVKGHFTEGNTLKLSHIEAVTGASADVTLGEAAVGETVYINGVKISLNDIPQDNRCPSDVQCIVKGSVTANVTLTSDTDRETRTINSDDKPVGFDAYLVSIVQVAPYPRSDMAIKKTDYKVQFKVVPASSE